MTTQMATEYQVLPTGCTIDDPNARHHAIRVSYRGRGKWAISDNFMVLHRITGEWDFESQPSSRTEDFKTNFRWELDEALAMAHSIVDDYTVNSRTYAEWQAHFAAEKAAPNA